MTFEDGLGHAVDRDKRWKALGDKGAGNNKDSNYSLNTARRVIKSEARGKCHCAQTAGDREGIMQWC